MTDNEIIEALGCCIRGNQCAYSCPYDDEEADCNKCTSALAKDALDLINRKDAEIERLKAVTEAELESMHNLGDDYEKALEEINRLKAENETLKYIIEKDQGLIIKIASVPVNEYNQKIKTETVNEFIQNFNLLLENLGDYHALCVYEIKDRLDIVKNEMVGDE